MNIYSTQIMHGSHAISGPHASKPKPASSIQQTASTLAKDEVTFSNAAQQVNQTFENAESSGEIRFDLVNRIRAEILAETYETQEKLDVALEKMLVSIG